jgi:hypothetical protein
MPRGPWLLSINHPGVAAELATQESSPLSGPDLATFRFDALNRAPWRARPRLQARRQPPRRAFLRVTYKPMMNPLAELLGRDLSHWLDWDGVRGGG